MNNEQSPPEVTSSGADKATLRGAPITIVFVLLILTVELAFVADELFSDGALRWRGYEQFAPIFERGQLLTDASTLMTSAALHGSLLHAGLNAAIFAFLAPPIERLVGPLYFGSALILMAIATPLGHWGVLALKGSLDLSFTIGASGVVFGLAALMIAFRAAAIRRAPIDVRPQLPNPTALLVRSSILIIGLNAALELLETPIGGVQISGAGHIGGYLAGLALSPLLIWAATRPKYER